MQLLANAVSRSFPFFLCLLCMHLVPFAEHQAPSFTTYQAQKHLSCTASIYKPSNVECLIKSVVVKVSGCSV